ncbi:MAG: DNA topoisomerase VI subunit B [Kiritimatiellae bacterium]|nr:DNA topoisomerase VI subunit B [Kiritimatiellia bacterium]
MKRPATPNERRRVETAETLAQRQREISVSEFFLKNRHLLGFDSPRRALLTAVKEAVDNSLDACEEAGIRPEVAVDIEQIGPTRFRITVTDNGPGIVRAQVPKIFAKLLYGSKFHRLRMARGQQGIGISAAGMYGQLTTGRATEIVSRTCRARPAHRMEVLLDTRANRPILLREEECDWRPTFPDPDRPEAPVAYDHGTAVTMELEAAYVRGRLSVDEFLQQCAIANPHAQLHYRLRLRPRGEETGDGTDAPADTAPSPTAEAVAPAAAQWRTFRRAVEEMPPPPAEILPHPHGVELGMLMQILKDTPARTLRSALASEFSRVSDRTALEICRRAGLDPAARPARIAHADAETLYRAIQNTKLMRPPTDCLAPIGEPAIVAGLQKEIRADFVTAVSRPPAVYRGNPFLIEAGLAWGRPEPIVGAEGAADEPVRVLRFANRVPLLYQAGACALTRAVISVNWKTYGLAQPKGALPVGPVVLLLHIASVWVPFTSESKDAVAAYPEILREAVFALQECGRRLAQFLSRRRREEESRRKREYIETYIPHLARGLAAILSLPERTEADLRVRLSRMLKHSRPES